LKKFNSTLSIFIIVVYLSNILGYTLVYFHLKAQVKKELLNRIRSEQFEMIETIKISKRDMANKSVNFRMVEDHEFSFEGKMYDIISKSEDDEYLIFLCINDEKEEKLDLAFRNHVENNFEDSAAKKFSSFPNKKNIDIGYISKFTIKINIFTKASVHDNLSTNSKNFISDVITPPPQLDQVKLA
jgi:hypothetical protein